MPFRLGPWEIALILLVVLIVFGAGKLPQIGGAIGKSIREFRKAQRDEDSEKDAESPKAERGTAKKVSQDNTRLS